MLLNNIEKFMNTEIRKGEVRLKDDEFRGYILTGIKEEEPFDELLVSWNGLTPECSSFKIEVQVRVKGEWSDFYPIALWNQYHTGGSYSKEDRLAKTLIDILKIKEPNLADAYRVRVWLQRTDFSEMPRLLRLYASVRNTEKFELKLSQEIDPVELEVPCRSQMIHHKSFANKICSPTCCGMVLAYYDIHIPTDKLIWQVYDKSAGIFGNWPFNTAAMATYGFDARVEFIADLYDALLEIKAGRPIITSVRYEEGELENAAIKRTDGHIIVLVGYEDGYIIVNDSAASDNAEVRRKYKIDQFLKVCNGVFYKLKYLYRINN